LVWKFSKVSLQCILPCLLKLKRSFFIVELLWKRPKDFQKAEDSFWYFLVGHMFLLPMVKRGQSWKLPLNFLGFFLSSYSPIVDLLFCSIKRFCRKRPRKKSLKIKRLRLEEGLKTGEPKRYWKYLFFYGFCNDWRMP
jgi:hypothetical protein